MFFRIDPARGEVHLEEPQDCTAFHVEAPEGAAASTLLDLLGDLAVRGDDEHVWLTAEGVRRLAAGRVGPDWEDEFAGMVAYATSKGWVDSEAPGGGAIRGHIARTPAAGSVEAQSRQERGMKIVVDFDLCESNAVCMAVAPELFEVRDDDFLYILDENPGEEMREKLEEAVQRCPKQAIKVEG